MSLLSAINLTETNTLNFLIFYDYFVKTFKLGTAVRAEGK